MPTTEPHNVNTSVHSPLEQPESTPGPQRQLAAILLGASLVVAWGLVLPSILALATPWPATLGEGIVLAGVQHWLAGAPLYPGPTPLYNGIDFPYPPVYALAVVPLLGAGVAPFVAARLVSTLGLVLTLVGIATIVTRASQRRVAGIGAALAFPLVSQGAAVWAVVGRVDSLALGLAVCGMACWLAAWRGHTVAAAVCLALALLTKETMVAAIAACVLACAVRREWRSAAWLCAGIGVPVVTVSLWLNTTSHGAYAFDLLTLGAVRPFALTLFIGEVLYFLLWSGLAFGVGAVALFRAGGTLELRLWCALAAAVFLTTVGKIGGAPYYAAELAVLGAIGLGLLSARVLAPLSEAHRSGDRTVVIQAGLVTVGLAAVAWLTITSDLAPGRWSTASAGAAHAQVVAAMRTAPGPILSDFAGDLLLAGRSDEVVDLRGVVQLANARQFDERPIVEQLQHGNFALLALDFDPLSTTAAEMQSSADTRLTPAMLAAVQASYQVNQTVTFRPSGRVAVLLVPKGSTP